MHLSRIHGSPGPSALAAPLIQRLGAECADRNRPLFVALDGRSGAGKSSIAAVLADGLSAFTTSSSFIAERPTTMTVTVIEGDQFYSGGSATSWDGRPAIELADRVIDWRRQRSVLEQLRGDGQATWSPFDWHSDDWDSDEPPRGEPITSTSATVVILEGAYSARPELHDLLDLRVLLDVPTDVRRRQLLEREGEAYRADWEARWSAAEAHYFATVMPAERFDLVLGRD